MNRSKTRICIWSNALFLKTGLSRNAKALLKEFHKSGKYELFHYCSGVSEGEPRLGMYPWKTIGCLPNSQHELAQLNQDPHKARMASYGNLKIKDFVKENKIDILVALDDLWSISEDVYKSEWIKGIHFYAGVTLDSLPLIDTTRDLCMNSKFVSWAKFGEIALKKDLKKHNLKPDFEPITIQGAVESEHYQPISKLEKIELRRKFGIPQDAILINFIGRNQLRKKYDTLIKALASYKKQYPNSKKVFLQIHTSWQEGWPLKRMIESAGLEMSDVLTTYVCKNCKEFEIKPYNGEQQDCKYCGCQKCQDTASITNGVADEDMKYIYGISDCALSVYTSGGLEYHCCEALLAGVPLATVSYSCGSEYTECPQVTEIDYVESTEIRSGFNKSEPSVQSCVKFIRKIEQMDESKRREIGRKGREWALKKFDSKVIAQKWMDLFDSLPKVDHSSITFEDSKNFNPNFQPDFSLDGEPFIKNLYSGFLDAQHPDDGGMQHWKSRLENSEDKHSIAQIFQQIAAKEVQKNQKIDIKDLLLKNDKKNVFFIMKESLGDCILSLSLLEGVKKQYISHNLNVITNPQFFEVYEGCEFVDNLIPHSPMLESEMAVIGAGKEEGIADVFIMPAVATQKHLNYLSNNNIELELCGDLCETEDWTLQTK